MIMKTQPRSKAATGSPEPGVPSTATRIDTPSTKPSWRVIVKTPSRSRSARAGRDDGRRRWRGSAARSRRRCPPSSRPGQHLAGVVGRLADAQAPPQAARGRTARCRASRTSAGRSGRAKRPDVMATVAAISGPGRQHESRAQHRLVPDRGHEEHVGEQEGGEAGGEEASTRRWRARTSARAAAPGRSTGERCVRQRAQKAARPAAATANDASVRGSLQPHSGRLRRGRARARRRRR